jgi:hypothetical protein
MIQQPGGGSREQQSRCDVQEGPTARRTVAGEPGPDGDSEVG